MNNEHLQETTKSLTDWMGIWDKALSDGIFEPEEKDQQAATPFDSDIGYDPVTCSMAGIDPILIQETERHIPNPVYPDSVGKDQDAPKPAWVNEDMLKELEELKEKLFKLENKFAINSGDFVKQNTEDKKAMSQIQSIRKQIDQVSDSLGVKDEPSPWVVNGK